MLRLRICIVLLLMKVIVAKKRALLNSNGDFLPHVRLAKDLMDPRRYDSRIRPVMNFTQRTKIVVSMSLYQILAINEKMQNIDLNVWVIQKWRDEFLGWSPHKYGLINSTILPYQKIWLPDTYIYNSVVMNREETERYINAVVTTNYWKKERGAQIMFMYPALYRTSCRIHIRFFPYDLQNCTLIISSWTSDKSSIDYVPEFDTVNLENFIPNEEWVVVSFHMRRKEEKFVCCPEPWVLLEASLVVRRKPLYYIVNLVVPTSVITLVAVTGFFTPASTSNERREKLSLGIDSLLAMSILLTMIAEQMPTISDYVPLFGIFYLAIIVIIFAGTLFSAFILNVHLQKTRNKPIPPLVSFIFFHKVAPFLSLRPPTALLELWMETGVRIKGLKEADPRFTMRLSSNKRSLGPPAPRKEKDFKYLNGQNGGDDRICNNLLGSSEVFKSSQVESDLEQRRPSPNTPKTAQKARNNWKRLAARANAKRKEEQNKINDIPFADGASLAPSTGYENPAINSARHKASIVSRPQSMLPALQLLYMQQGGGPASGSAADAFLLEAKLRRRYAHEWEFLASVLDRVLLIVFSGLVLLVTAAMIAVGEAIHFSYSLVEDFPQNVTEFNQDV
ncbi:unnamed protein product [Bursaphelenchus xylophilus]|uniref:(pine wood nematode) hypothetical protein n=1 Tax=Bursaphelenchus xylophilus TaxID=6326 RepID=A0A1I7RH61_BURXY|nr:unnamed protein product [Bursaphelenchus xylophilus]CAG9115963.1 unnamed protein product [Bursaphelenchus xylophilus]